MAVDGMDGARDVPCQVDRGRIIENEIHGVFHALRIDPRWSKAMEKSRARLYSAGVGNIMADKGMHLADSLGLRHSRFGEEAPSFLPYGVGPSLHHAGPSSASSSAGGPGITSASSSSGTGQANAIIASFATLRGLIRASDPASLEALDASTLLSPFLSVIRSPDATGRITKACLNAIESFLSYRIIHSSSPSLKPALAGLVQAITHCKFDPSDAVSDELVLLRILTILEQIVCDDHRVDSSLTTTGVRYMGLGRELTDESVCEIMETGLSMCCQMRLSEMLRKSAETTLARMTRVIFQRLADLPIDPSESTDDLLRSGHLDEEDEDLSPAATGSSAPRAVRMIVPDPSSEDNPAASTPAPANEASFPNPEMTTEHEKQDLSSTSENDGQPATNGVLVEEKSEQPGRTHFATTELQEESTMKDTLLIGPPYGMPSIRELLRVLVNLLDPHDSQHTDTMRLMSLGLLNIAFETSGHAIADHYSLASVVQGDLCRNVFQLARSDNLPILTNSLRLISTIFLVLRSRLKLQQELLLTFILDRLAPEPPADDEVGHYREESRDNNASPSATLHGLSEAGTVGSILATERQSSTSSPRPPNQAHYTVITGEPRELLLVCLGLCTSSPQFLIDLYVNYDCDVDCEDLFERVIKFLCANVRPTVTLPDEIDIRSRASKAMSFEILLSLVNELAERSFDPDAARMVSSRSGKKFVSPTTLAKRKRRKRVILQGAEKFNFKPKYGIQYLMEHQIIESEGGKAQDHSLASFLKSTSRVDKRLLGEYLSRPENVDLLRAYISLFEFSRSRIDEAMREMLEAFRLPGEAQQIARILENFAEHYYSTNPTEVADGDAAYVLAYSVIMLNTDQHNPRLKARMTIEQYSRNLRGTNGGKDFPLEYLTAIYNAIRRREIVMPEEHVGQLGFDYAWKELLQRARRTGQLTECDTSIYNKEVFLASWRPIVAALANAFDDQEDDVLLQRAVAAHGEIASLAEAYDQPEIIDRLLSGLARASKIAAPRQMTDIRSNPTSKMGDQQIVVSPLAVQLGRHFKNQLAATILFNIARSHTSSVRKSWLQIFEIYQELFANSLLPESCLQTQDFLQGPVPIPLRAKVDPPVKSERRAEGGLLSALSSYLMSPYPMVETRREATDEEVDYTMSALDCVTSCQVDQLLTKIKNLDAASTEHVMWALRTLADRRRNVLISRITPEKGSPIANRGQSTPEVEREKSSTAPYDPALVYYLEVMTDIFLSMDESRYGRIWSIFFELTSEILSWAAHYHIRIVERTVANLLRVCIKIAPNHEMQDQLFLALDCLRTLPSDVMKGVLAQMMAGLSKLYRESPGSFQTQTQWTLLFSLLRDAARHRAASKYAFDMAERLVTTSTSGHITESNFQPLVQLLDGFATAANFLPVHIRTGSRDQNAEADTFSETLKDRARRAVDCIFLLRSEVPSLMRLSNRSEEDKWANAWLPLMTALSQQSCNGCRDVRQLALAHLSRILVEPSVVAQNGGKEEEEEQVVWRTLFYRVLFPMLEELLKPEVFARDPSPAGMGETRLRALDLLSKNFLHYLIRSKWRDDDMLKLWVQIIDYFDRFMSAQQVHNSEAIVEMLKNALLVMASSGYLIKPAAPESSPSSSPHPATAAAAAADEASATGGSGNEEGRRVQHEDPHTTTTTTTTTAISDTLWHATFERVDRFLPGMQAELFSD